MDKILSPASKPNSCPIESTSTDSIIAGSRSCVVDLSLKGEGLIFSSQREVVIALNEEKLDKNSLIKLRTNVRTSEGILENKVIDTVAGRVLFNNLIPKEVVKLVQNLVLVVSCKASGNLKAQEQLEKEQHEIWKEEARIAAIKAEK